MKAKSLNLFAAATMFLVAATAGRAQVTNFYQAVTNLSPAAYWPLQETAQPPIADVETNLGSFGAIANAYYSSTNAIKNQAGVNSGGGDIAVRFISGTLSGSFLGVPNTSPQISLPVGPFTVEAWVYPSNVVVNQTIMGQAGLTATPGLNGAASGAGWTLNQNFDPYTGQTTPGWSFHVYNGVNIFGGADALVVTNYATNTWYHLVGVFDGVNATLYVNGVNATTTAIPMPAGTSFIPDTWDFLQLGCGRGQNENQFNGEIEEAAIYTSALTPTKISQDFNAINNSSSSYQSTILGNNPVMYWRMNSPANNIVQSISAYPSAVSYGKVANMNGLYSSTATPGSSGPAYFGLTNGTLNESGLACAFNGMGCDSTNQVSIFTNNVFMSPAPINGGVIITNLPGVFNPITNSFSLMYWVKCNPMDDRRNGVFGHSDSNWRSSLLANQVTANAGKGGDLSASFNMNDGNWHFITFVYTNTLLAGPEGASVSTLGTNYMYVDGVLITSAVNTNLSSAGSFTNMCIGVAPDKNSYGNGNIYGGTTTSNSAANGSQMLLGSMAHVAFFTNALTPLQVQSLYSAAGAPPLIQKQPSPTIFTDAAGTTNVFGAVTASGASTLAYNWYYNTSSNYSGATQLTDGVLANNSGIFGSATSQLTVTNLGSGNSGFYYVVITNNYGSVTSVLSRLVVTGQIPVITAQNPTGPFSAYAGQNNLGISVTANGPGTLTYQWYTNSVADTTAGTSASYPWMVKTGQAGTTFQCIVGNLNGTATSAVATLTTILTVPAGAGNGAFQANLLGLNPVAYWPLQETAQPPLAEIETNYGSFGAAGNAYYASTNASAGVAGVTGDGDTAVNLYGKNGSLLAVPQTNGLALPVGPFTVEAWVYPTNISGSEIIVSQTGLPGAGGVNAGANSAGWALVQNYVPSLPSLQSTTNLFGWCFHVFNGNGPTGGAEAVAPNNISLNTWYHLVGIFDGTNCYLYVDGTNAGTSTSPINGSYVQDTWDQLVIGSVGGNLNSDLFSGSIDEVAVYTNALSATQVMNHYNAVGGSSYSSTVLGDHPYMYWRMDNSIFPQSPSGSAYPIAFNYGSAANMNGLYFSGTTPGIPGPSISGLGTTSFGCAVNGIGTSATNNIGIFMPNSYYSSSLLYSNALINSGILCTNEAPSLCMTNQPFTIACWFKANPADSDRFQNIFGAHGDNGPRFAFQAGQVQFYVGNSGGANLASGTTPNCQDGNWHFAVGVYTNSGSFASGVSSLYVDGNLVNSAAIATAESAVLTNLAIMIGGDPQRAQSGNGTGLNERFFSGSIAHMAYFTNALTPQQIVNLYTNATAGVPPQGPIITGQPVTGRTAGSGGNGGVGTGSFIFFGVIATGDPTLSYQWYYNANSNYNGTAIVSDGVKYTNTTTVNMTVSNLANSDSGYYYVIVTNNYGSATSILATLQVSLGPVITAQSPNGAFSLYPNQTATLSVTVGQGETPYSYFWFTNGVQDASVGGASSTYSVSAGHPAVSGETYQCLVSNQVTTVTMVPGALNTLTIVPLPASITNSPYATNVLGLGASGYWPMHEVETQPLIGDVETNYGSLGKLGNGYYQDWAQPEVIHNSPGALAGTTNSAVTFNNWQGGDALVIPHSSQLLTLGTSNFPAFSLEAWVKPFEAGSGTPNGTNMTIMGEGGGTTSLNGSANLAGFDLRYGGTANTFSLIAYNGSGGASYEQRTANFYPPGTWYHIVCLWSGSNVEYFINGQEAGFLSGNPSSSDNPQTLNPDVCSPITIGAGHWGNTGAKFPFIGEIDEVAVYTNLLTQQQIQNDYAAGTTASSNYFQAVLGNGPVLYYRMDAPSYTQPPFSAMTATLTNYGSVPLNGVYVPSAFPGSAAGPAVGSLLSTNLSGTNSMQGNGVMSFADAGINSLWNPTNITSFSYTVWERGFPCDDRNFNEMFCANDSTWRSGINNAGKFQIHGNVDVIPTNIINDGNWHQWVMTAQGSLSNSFIGFTNTLYIDGVLALQQWATNAGNNPAASPGPEVTIGDEWGKTNCVTESEAGRSYAGDICEAAFFNGTVLTPGQVQSLYNSGGMPPGITSQPLSGTAVATKTFTNSVSANGAQPLGYQWYTNGVAIGGSATNFFFEITNGVNTAVLGINPVEPGNAGSYYVVVTNAYGAVTSSVVNLTVLGSPIITNQFPVPYTNQYAVYAGANPTFTINAIGAPPLAYYWSSNGVPIVGASSSNFTYVNVQAAFTNINCIVSNFLGTATSTVWSAFVVPDPVGAGSVGLAPYPQSVLALHPVGYWRMNDTNLDGPDNSGGDFGYICHDYISGNDGMYTNLTLGNSPYNPVADPSDTSAQFGIADQLGSDFGDSLAFGIAGMSFAAPTGSNMAFTVEAWVSGQPQTFDSGIVTLGWGNGGEQFNLDCGSDGGAPSHAFRFFFRDASGAVHSVVSTVVPSTVSQQFGPWYHLVGVVDEVNNDAMVFYINGLPVGTTALTSGLGVLSSTNLMGIGARTSSLTTNYNDQFVGNINDVAVYNYALSASNVLAQYSQSGVPPFFTQLPTATTNASGNGLMVIPALLAGTGPLNYTWSDVSGGTNIVTGSTNGYQLNAGLTVSNVPGGWNNDQIKLTVSNPYGSTNVLISLTVFTNAPQITASLPPQVNLTVGQTYTYSLTANGAAPLVYQWYTNGVAIGGATLNTSAVSPLVTGNAGVYLYSVIVTNIYGSATNFSTLTVIPVPTNSFASYILGLKPVGYWPLQETNPGAIVTIETNYGTLGAVGNAYYAATTPTETNIAFNQLGALTGSGDNDASVGFNTPSGTNELFVPRLSPKLTLTTPFTMECWINTTSLSFSDLISEDGNGLNSAAGGGNWGGPRLCYAGNNGGGPALQLYIANGNGTTRNDVSTPANTLPVGAWHHCVATYDGTTTVLYIDGVQQFSGTGLGGANTMAIDTSSPLTIGDGLWTGNSVGGQRAYTGDIDDVAIYTNLLTATQVHNHYLSGTTTGSNYMQTVVNDQPLLYYRMDCSGFTNTASANCPTAINFGSAPVNGTYLSGTRPGYVAGPPIAVNSNDVASPVNGITASIDAGSNSVFNTATAQPFSALCWVKGNPGDSRLQGLVTHGVNWALDLVGSSGLAIWTNSAGSVASTTIVNDGNWHLVAGVYDGANNYIYVDGALNKNSAASGSIVSDATHDIYLGGNSAFSVVGVNQQVLGGAIAQAAFFTNALSGAQIQSLYQIAVPLGISTNPTNIIVAVTNNQLSLSWPADHLGWQLQAQTNSVSVGISTNWGNVNGSTATNQVLVPISLTNGCVFYRLIYP